MIPLKDLVVRVANDLEILINETLMDRFGNRIKVYRRLEISEDAVKSFQLFRIFRKQVQLKSLFFPMSQIPDEHVKLPVKGRLLLCVKFNFILMSYSRRLIAELDKMPMHDLLLKLIGRYEIVFVDLFSD